jgi:hypothetical protein
MGLIQSLSRLSGPRPVDAVTKAAVALLIAKNERENISEVLKRNWPKDQNLPLVVKAATAPTSTATVAPTAVVADFMDVLAGASAGVAVLGRGISLDASVGAIFTIPTISASANSADFVAELSPIPVEQFALSDLILSLKKLASIASFTREAVSHTVPNLELIVGAALRESVAMSFDSKLFDATAGSDARPPGLRNGISAVAAASADPDANVAMFADLSAIIGAVAAVAGANPILIVAGPAQSRRLKMRIMAGRGDLGFEVFTSSGIAEGLVIGIVSNVLASAIDPMPTIEVGDQTTLHMEDTTPLPLVDGASTPAPGVRSLWQTDALALKIRLRCAWGLRSSGGLAWISGANW